MAPERTEQQPLSERQIAILRAVCRDFVVNGGEVGSSALVQRHGFRWSSATLRHELSVLERMGLLRRPHRSAGCSPTIAGLRRYVDDLSTAELAVPQLRDAVDRGFGRLAEHLRDHDPGHGIRAAVCLLSEVSGCMAVSFIGTAQSAQAKMEQVDVVPLVAGRALVVLTMEGGATHIQPIELEPPRDREGDELTAGDAWLRRLQERLRWLCVGRTLPAARETLLRRLGEHEAQVDRLLAQALRVALSLCAVAPLDPLWMQIAGQPALARGLPDAQRLGDVLALLEDDQRLAEVLDQLLPPGPPKAWVQVGLRGLLAVGAGSDDDADLAAEPRLSLVGCRVPVGPTAQAGARAQDAAGPGAAGKGGARDEEARSAEGPNRGAVALLGPARMDYAAMIPLVEYAARALAARVSA